MMLALAALAATTPEVVNAVFSPALQLGALGVLAIFGVGMLLLMSRSQAGFMRSVEALEKRIAALDVAAQADARETRAAVAASERRVSDAVHSAIDAVLAQRLH
jgi:hypothetical protein